MNYKNFEWVTIIYENASYDVYVSTAGHGVDEIRPIDSEIDITPVMDHRVIDWMEAQALAEIALELNEPPCRSMSKKERLIEGV